MRELPMPRNGSKLTSLRGPALDSGQGARFHCPSQPDGIVATGRIGDGRHESIETTTH